MKKGKINLLGINISDLKKEELIREISQRLDQKEKTFVITPYPEFFYLAFHDFRLRDLFNRADYAIADGIGIVWAAHYLDVALKTKSYYAKIAEAFFQMLLTGAKIIFRSKQIYNIIPEKITGSDFFWDLCAIAAQKELSVFLLGGRKNIPARAAEKIKQRFPQIQIAGYSSADAADKNLTEQINKSGADILFVAFGPAKQEKWIDKNLNDLNIRLAIGVGGTFDYIAGEKIRPPKFIRQSGFEWLFRLITQPARIKRIWHATVSFTAGVIRHKVFISMPYRENAAAVIINRDKKIFVAKRVPWTSGESDSNWPEHWQFPQGGIDKNEPEDQAVLREVREETGTSNVKIIGKSKIKNSYTWNLAVRPLLFNKFKYRGQEQAIFYLKYFGDDSDIVLDQHELVEYKWVELDELVETLHPFRKNIASIVLSEIKEYIDER